jgi:hypothetical protein
MEQKLVSKALLIAQRPTIDKAIAAAERTAKSIHVLGADIAKKHAANLLMLKAVRRMPRHLGQ